MATETEQLLIQLEARITDFEKSFQRANKTASDNWGAIERRGRQAGSRMQSDMGKAVAGIADSLSGLGSSVASSFGVGGVLGLTGFLALAIRVNSELSRLPGLAKQAGTSIERIQEVKFAANMGGVSDEDFASGIESAMKNLDEASRQVNSLQRLFNANGLSIRQANGQLITFDQLLERAATLMAGATEPQKARIADMLGLSKSWIEVLENGPAAFRKAADEARNAGGVIDSETVQRAKQFDVEWNRAIVRFKSGMTGALTDLAEAFGEFWTNLLDSVPGATAIRDFFKREFGGLSGMTIPELESVLQRSIEQGVGQVEIDRIQAEIDRRLGKKPLRLTVQPEIKPGSTVVPKDDGAEKNVFDRAVRQAQRQIAQTNADTASIGLNTEAHERARVVAALETAAKEANTRAGFANAEVTAEQRQKITELADAMEAAAKKQRETEAAFRSMNESLQFGGGLAVDFIDKMTDGASKFSDVMESMASAIKRAVIQAALLGSGPLAGLFGTAPTVSGGTGGILGALFGGFRADGGDVSPGRAYVVGEKQAELFVPRTAGRILPSAQVGGAQVTTIAPTINVQVEGGSRGMAADAELGAKVATQVRDAVRAEIGRAIRQQMRPGGMLRG